MATKKTPVKKLREDRRFQAVAILSHLAVHPLISETGKEEVNERLSCICAVDMPIEALASHIWWASSVMEVLDEACGMTQL